MRDARATLRTQMKMKKWTASEVAEIEAIVREQPDATARLLILHNAIQQAKAEGRFADDLASTRLNIAAKIPSDAWRWSVAELALAAAYARQLDKEAAKQGKQPGYGNALHKLAVQAQAQGRIIDEGGSLGAVSMNALPGWAREAGVNTRTLTTVEAKDQRITVNQADRWDVWQRGLRLALDRAIAGKPLPAWQPGFGWSPSENPAEDHSWGQYAGDTGQARQALAHAAQQDLAEKRGAADAAFDGQHAGLIRDARFGTAGT